jgi:hypothetical protein
MFKRLNLLAKVPAATRLLAGLAAAALALAGCVTSTGPVLRDSKPLIGVRGTIHGYSIREGAAHDPKAAQFEWERDRYRVRGRRADFSEFTAHPFEGRDFILQARSKRGARQIEYALARRVADGVYFIVPIDEADAEDDDRIKFCTKTKDSFCRISSPEQLVVFARKTADKTADGGGLAVIVPSPGR